MLMNQALDESSFLTKGDLRMLFAMRRDFCLLEDLHNKIGGIFMHFIIGVE